MNGSNRKKFFAKGADVGWLKQMETDGYKFYNDNGKEEDCLNILKSHGINSIRLRVWVNPKDGHCSKNEMVEMAARVINMGFRLMVDIHYSDSWADPEKQFKPEAWKNHTSKMLEEDVYNHTIDVMSLLKEKNINPEWVQVGNEITYGMLWPDGKKENFEQLSCFLNSGYDAVKKIFPSAKVIIHLDQGDDRARYIEFFDKHKANGGKYDVIGVSYYPYWIHKNYKETIGNLLNNLNEFTERYGKEVMVCEIGGEDTEEEETYNMIKEVISGVKKIPKEKGLGVFYWEPEGAFNYSGYKLSAWGNNGQPTKALDAFID